MAINSAFQPRGKGFALTASAASQSAVIPLSALATDNFPSQMKWVNNGTVDVWVDIADAAVAAAFPTPGTVDAGTPTYGFRLKPGIIEVYGFVVRRTLANAINPPQFVVNYIGASAGQAIEAIPGEGL